MDDVLTLIIRERAANRPFLRLGGIGCADERAKILHGIVFFEYDRHAGSAGHKDGQLLEERAATVDSVEALRFSLRECNHSKSRNTEPRLLNPTNYLADEVLSYTIGLKNR